LPGPRATWGGVNDRQQVRIAVILGVALYVALPPKLTIGPVWVAPLAVGLFLVPIIALAPKGVRTNRLIRVLSIISIAALNFFNIVSVVLLINILINSHLKEHAELSAAELLHYGAQIWMTNIIVFALWFWELDSKGPFYRDQRKSADDFEQPDFLFPQMSLDPSRVRGVPPNWKPQFLDYVYVSFTNALAISPTDTMPLTRTAKMLMLVESLISFVTVALILARSVNILS
jgi:uncharacterized membrane protein